MHYKLCPHTAQSQRQTDQSSDENKTITKTPRTVFANSFANRFLLFTWLCGDYLYTCLQHNSEVLPYVYAYKFYIYLSCTIIKRVCVSEV